MAYVDLAYMVMVHIFIVYIVMAHVVMAYIVMDGRYLVANRSRLAAHAVVQVRV